MRLLRTSDHLPHPGILAALCASLCALGMAYPRSAHAQINIGGPNPSGYLQNFDSLSNGGTSTAFANNSTIPGLYIGRPTAAPATYLVSNGGSAAGGIYSYGATGSTERALGSLIVAVTNANFGFRFVNTSPDLVITSFNVQYVGEFWRRGGNTQNPTQELRFGYAIFDPGTGSIGDPFSYSGFTPLDYRVTANGAATLTAGNEAPISTQGFNETIVLDPEVEEPVRPGQELWIRWEDRNDTGNDHGLAIDNLQVTFTLAPAAVVPEPSALPLALFGAITTATAARWRRGRRRA